MAIPRFIKNHFFGIFSYYFKGAKVDAALSFIKRSRNPINEFPRPGALHLPEGPNFFNSKDTLRRWEIKSYYKLILKNNSKFNAYNIELKNLNNIFTFCEKIKKLTSLAPNEALELDANIIDYHISHSGVEVDNLPQLPANVENSVLEICYTNEAGTKLKTKFWVSTSQIINEYSFY